MKIIYRGFVYEHQTDLFLSDEEAKKKYAEHLENQELAELSDNGNDNLADDLRDTKANVLTLLKKWNLKGKQVGSDYIFEELGEYFIIRNREITSVSDLISDTRSYYKEFPEFATINEKLNEEFWKYPEPLYHATDCENKEEILEGGLYTGNGTGMTNRHSHGVFTSTELDGYIDSYGKCKFKIDTAKMKQDGHMPFVQREPEVLEYIISQAIGHTYGINVDSWVDSSGGMDPNTWIVGSDIDPKYLKLVVDDGEDIDY